MLKIESDMEKLNLAQKLLAVFAASKAKGFTILELLVAMAILGILLTVAVPSMGSFSANQELIGAAEQIYGHLQQMRTESIARSNTMVAKFAANGTTTWTYGLSSNFNCDLTQTTATGTNACITVVSDGDSTYQGVNGATDTGDLVLSRFTSSDFDTVKVDVSGFSSSSQVVFRAPRGTAAAVGQVNLTGSNGKKLRLAVNVLGKIRLCTPDGSVDNYRTC
jgi:type IV fimbrial biogenesis protein FimT